MSASLTRRAAVGLGLLAPLALVGCSAEKDDEPQPESLDALGAPTPVPLSHATQFSLDAYDGGYRLATLASGDRLLIVPEGADAPAGLPSDVAAIRRPLANVYLVSTGMICLVDAIGALDAVSVSSVRAEDSPVPAFTARLEGGEITYGGLYREPDYELIAARSCPLAIENTNIDHVPEVRAKLEELGVTVLMEQSSREGDMLGRLEWIKLMGAVFGREDEAAEVFDDVAARVEEAAAQGPLGKTVAFFYVNEDGAAVTRRAGDYFAQMIEAAGGEYVSFSEEGATDSSPHHRDRGDGALLRGRPRRGRHHLQRHDRRRRDQPRGPCYEECADRGLYRRTQRGRLDLRRQPLPTNHEHGRHHL